MIQEAIDSLGPDGGAVLIPKGTHVVDQTIRLHNRGGGVGRGVTLVGESGGARSPGASRIVWNGPEGGTMLEILSRDCRVEGIQFEVMLGARAGRAVFVNEGVSGRATTNNEFSRCRFLGAMDHEIHLGRMDDAVVLGEASSKLDFMAFRDCEFRGVKRAFRIESTSGQSKQHVFDRCWFESTSATDFSGTALDLQSGSFVARSCSFFGFERAIHTSRPTDRISIENCFSERTKRLLDTSPASTSKMWPITIRSGAFNLVSSTPIPFKDGTPFGGEFVVYTHNGVISIEDCIFGDGATHDPHFKISAGRDSIVVSKGNTFPNEWPFSVAGLRSFACRGLNIKGSKTTIDDHLVQ